VAGNAAGVATDRLNQLTLAYLLSRAVYVYTYVVLQDNARMAGLRPFVCEYSFKFCLLSVWVRNGWLTLLVGLAGIAVMMTIFVAAGNAVN
jgi:uncharacterized MAPEG superfamily protein